MDFIDFPTQNSSELAQVAFYSKYRVQRKFPPLVIFPRAAFHTDSYLLYQKR
jgi:hypothetical protein